MAKPIDLSEFEAPRTPCNMGKALLKMSDEDREKFTAALAAEHISTARILDRLRARGIGLNKDTVRNHRTGRCRCE